MKTSAKLALVGLASAGALLASAPAASAAIVCNDTVCWHTHRAYAYRPEWGVVVHPNHWRWGPGDHYVWREHAGRGYWRDDAWVPF